MTKLAFTKEFALFVDDLGGLVWAMKGVRKHTWDVMAKDLKVCTSTLANLAERRTQNPTLYTCWKILRGLDNSGVIRHSQLERYRKVVKPKRAHPKA